MFKEVVGRACKRAVSELMLEFDTGGNVRFEEGRPGDVWFSSCADLVKSRVVRYRNLGMIWCRGEDRGGPRVLFVFFFVTRFGVVFLSGHGMSLSYAIST